MQDSTPHHNVQSVNLAVESFVNLTHVRTPVPTLSLIGQPQKEDPCHGAISDKSF